MPSPNIQNVCVGYATMYTAPKDTVAPLDTLAAGAAWPTPWVYVGGTEEGIKLLHSSSTQDIRIEEQSTPVFVLTNEKNVRIQVALSEDTIESMKLAYGGGTITTQAAATGVPGKKTLTLQDALDKLAVGFEAVNPAGFWRRTYMPSVLSVGDSTTEYRRATNNRAYTVELRAVSPSDQIKIWDQTAIAL